MKVHKLSIAFVCLLGLVTACKNNGYDKKIEGEKSVVQPPAADTIVKDSTTLRAEKGRVLFEENCTACHALHKKIIGPALTGITKRREMDWLLKFTKNAPAMIDSGDPIAQKLAEEYQPTIMTEFVFMTDEQVRDIYHYIENAETNIQY
jgi:cytochrome c551/c552